MPKSKYRTHVEPNLALIEMWARDGLSRDQIAKNLSVAPSTFYKYTNEHSELSERLIVGRDLANAQVVNALFRSCIGFEYQEQVMAPSGFIQEITRYAKPNVGAITFWLKNKMSDEWSDKQEIGLSGEVKTSNEQTTRIIHELVADPEVAERVRERFRQDTLRGISP